ncbi:MAG: dihydropteroate synthase [Candidatus Latescibacterota bacterium]|nr:MAG: dihydropteroate synthase [Candidatus Latescibacterota bacterium]
MSDIRQTLAKRPILGRDFVLEPERRPLIMGILNVTPDSFSDGGTFFQKDDAYAHAVQMVEDGADIIDIGGESTRPGSDYADAAEELRRIMPVIESIAGKIPVPISVDTRRARVARRALEAGCRIINDVSACRDPEMPAVAREFDVPIIIMHMLGDPDSMQDDPVYEDVVREVTEFLASKAEMLEQHGIDQDKIIVDPGIGFGKRFQDNLDLLKSIDTIRSLGYPVTIGASRKRFIGELLDSGSSRPDERLSGNLAVAAWCYRSNVEIIRVHDVKETVGYYRVADAIEHPSDYTASW